MEDNNNTQKMGGDQWKECQKKKKGVTEEKTQDQIDVQIQEKEREGERERPKGREQRE